jgi:iron-sulfur cluster insertion protein
MHISLDYESFWLTIDFFGVNHNILCMSDSFITVTHRAAERIHAIAAKQGTKAALRVAVNGGGCSGFQYDFVLDAKREDDDKTFECEGATVLVDSTSLEYLAGSTLDFIDDLMGQSFRIQNPQAKSSCGCGTSFSL